MSIYLSPYLIFQAGSRDIDSSQHMKLFKSVSWDAQLRQVNVFLLSFNFLKEASPQKQGETILFSPQPVSIERPMAANKIFLISSFILGTIA